MDPLQAFSQEWQSLVGGGAAAAQKAVEAVDLEALRNWQSEAEGEEAGATDSALVFPVDPELNGRIYLFEGKIWNLRIDAIDSRLEELTALPPAGDEVLLAAAADALLAGGRRPAAAAAGDAPSVPSPWASLGRFRLGEVDA